MTIVGLVVVAGVALLLIGLGVVAGWTIGTNDRQIDVLARRLAADAAITRLTRETLRAARDVVRRSAR